MSDHTSPPVSPGDQPGNPPVAETPKTNKKTGNFELTSVEGLLFFNIIRFNKDTSAVDWDQVAIHSNLKNAASAKVRFRQIQKKYDFETGPKATPKAPSTQKGGSRKRKADVDAHEGGNNHFTEDTPSKKQKQPARKRNGPTGGKGKSTAKGKLQNTGTDTDTNTNGAAGAVDNEVTAKQTSGANDGGNQHVNSFTSASPLVGGNQNMNTSPITHDNRPLTVAPFELNLNPIQGRAQQAPHGGMPRAQLPMHNPHQQQQQQQQQQHLFGRGFPPAAFQRHYMGTGPFGQLEADPAAFYGFPLGRQNDQQTTSPYAGQVKKEDEDIY